MKDVTPLQKIINRHNGQNWVSVAMGYCPSCLYTSEPLVEDYGTWHVHQQETCGVCAETTQHELVAELWPCETYTLAKMVQDGAA